MDWDFPKIEEDPWYRKAYNAKYGSGAFERDFLQKGDERKELGTLSGLKEHRFDGKRFFWDHDKAVGVIENKGRFVGVACLAAKEVQDAEGFVKRFGLDFRKDIQWRGIAGLLEHLSNSPLFKAVLVTSSKVPFKLEQDISERAKGRMKWTATNYSYHRDVVDSLNRDVQASREFGMFTLPKKLLDAQARESVNAVRYLRELVAQENAFDERKRQHNQIKERLFAACLLFYVYTSECGSADMALEEIVRKRNSVKMEIIKAYFISCVDVADPDIVFTGFVPNDQALARYGGLALAADVAGFTANRDVAVALRKMFTLCLDVPSKEFQVEEQIHVPGEEVSTEGPRKAFVGYVMSSVVKDQATKRRVYFPLDILVRHSLILGSTRSGKSMLALTLIREALASGIKVVLFDPHGSIAKRLRADENLMVYRKSGDVTAELGEIYDTASQWQETNTLRLLVVLDETRLLKARNLASCVNQLGKRGVSFCMITQYSTSLPPEVRNVGTYFILSNMTEVEMQRFREITLHPSSGLISRLPRGASFLFSPYFYPEPIFVRHRLIE